MNPPASVLVVDDDSDLLFFMDLLLTHQGYQVITLQHCQDIFHYLEKKLPDLIILDINLGLCVGTEICAALKKTARYAHIPVILYSANKYNAGIYQACGAEAYIEKPFSNDFLLETVGRIGQPM